MSTTVHIPQGILTALDNKAKKLHISRNKLIIKACEKEIYREWPEEFLKKKLRPNKELKNAVDEMMNIIKSDRHGNFQTSQ